MYKIKKYTDDRRREWDIFIDEQSFNGTFLQSRRFIEYHPKDKFDDCSIMIYNEKDQLIAICLANQIKENCNKIFIAHQGTTFGGLIVDKKRYNSKYLFSLINDFKEFLENNYDEAIIKQTPDVFSTKSNALFEYIYQYYGFEEHKELSTYVDLNKNAIDILKDFSQGKRTNVHNCEKAGLVCEEIEDDENIKVFYRLLIKNLSKYNVKPVHSLEELLDFKNKRLKDECEFYAVFDNKKMVAGSMMFYFKKTKTAHTQYLAQDQDYTTLSPMTFLYYSMIEKMKEKGYKRLSWGIVTENNGREINRGLLSSKEDFGSFYTNNKTYHILFNNKN